MLQRKLSKMVKVTYIIMIMYYVTPLIPLYNGFYMFPLSRAINSNRLIFDPSEVEIHQYSKVFNLLLLNIAISCENVHMTFLIATCICVQTVFRPERCSLKDDTFEKLNMMIKCNHQIKSG